MATLGKRATPPQAMLLRIVEGSIKNVCDAHQKEFDPYFARSVAKRAVGTLSAAMPAVLAAKPSEKLGVATLTITTLRAARRADLVKPAVALTAARARVGADQRLPRSAPLRLLEQRLFSQMRAIKLSGNTERANAFIDVLRMISTLKETPNA